ncbi:thiamine diphosphokinase [Aspergillus homomorphus CBS 101889]|uniref:Thiamine pyrophosphokinase n=1 Tax=Aspergillus homomorphus (strain CBS 101889) TaxID=1450537 RepID=A0A395HJ87_ASPHC|nr:thiamine pyrophosphokinase [Aspergillus homomorphus CBS 101889]RAL07245.1 thiamine pyrophosphokinase [Aspergillus homomorphus CBS 101889]
MDLPYRLKTPVTEWDPTQFFREGDPPSPYALLILNHPINEKAYEVLQQHACMTVCADGGANRFYEMMKARGREYTDFPTAIIGDLDSINPQTRTHYETQGVPVIQHVDDYSTDFHKSLQYIRSNAASILAGAAVPPPNAQVPASVTPQAPAQPQSQATAQAQPQEPTTTPPLDILVLGGLGGRVDQAFSQIHHLFYMTQELRQTSPGKGVSGGGSGSENLYLVSEESITFVLQAGRNIVQTPRVNRPIGEGNTSEEGQGETEREGQAGDVGAGAEGNNTATAAAAQHLLEENVGIIPLCGPARITTAGFQWDVADWKTEIGGQLSTSNHIRADVVKVEAKVPVLLTLELAERFKKK